MNQDQQQNDVTAQNVGNDNITLAQINEMLNDAGFPIVSPEKVSALQSVAPRDRIIRAIRNAKGDPGARAFLQKIFVKVGIPIGPQAVNSEAEQGAPAPQNVSSHGQHQSPPQQQGTPAGHGGAQQGPQNSQGSAAGGYPSNNDSAPSGGPGDAQKMSPEDRISMHVYGGKAALCFEADMTKQGVPTVALDAALSTAPRQYNWGGKVRLQMTKAELPVVAAVLLGVLPKCEFSSHGPENNKGFAMERQDGGKIYVKVFSKGEGVRGVPVMASDVFYVTSLVFRQLQKTNPWMDTMSLMGLIRATQPGQ